MSLFVWFGHPWFLALGPSVGWCAPLILNPEECNPELSQTALAQPLGGSHATEVNLDGRSFDATLSRRTAMPLLAQSPPDRG